MLIYFDESYDLNHKYLLLGALFNPHPRYLHRELTELKKKHGFLDKSGKCLEIKYNNCTTKNRLELAKGAVDIFMKSTSYFRGIVVEQSLVDLERFGNKSEENKIKMARAYKKFAEILIANNTKNIFNGVLLTDELTRCKGDKFIEVMKLEFCVQNGKHCTDPSRPALKDIRDFDSSVETFQVNQINDILLGCILNNHFPTTAPYKNELRAYLLKCLGINSLLKDYWGNRTDKEREEHHPKYNIRYWQPKN
jgi:hypothetical protein